MPYREQNSNKGTFGKVLNFCGSKNYIGAAYLSAISSLKAGAGYSALAADKNIIRSVSALLPEAVYMTRNEGLKKLNNFDVILIGCGLGTDFKAKSLFKKVISNIQNKPIVIDADGLNIFSCLKDKEILRFAQNNNNAVLTPHPAEAGRLLGINTEEVLNNPENSAKELSKKFNCVIVLKLHRTIICDKYLTIHINEHGNSALAKAGTGDVLAGIISGLLAQKMPPFEAAKLGVYLHSRAGEIASGELTEYSVLASDIPKYLPKAISQLI